MHWQWLLKQTVQMVPLSFKVIRKAWATCKLLLSWHQTHEATNVQTDKQVEQKRNIM
jgi:hypothetical protein